MKNLIIHNTAQEKFVPSVFFNATTGVCEIGGESYMEETYPFFKVLYQWLEEYTNTGRSIEFIIKLIYFNTSSSKCLLDILRILKVYQEKGGQVKVYWHTKRGDEDIHEEVEDFRVASGLEITLVYI